MTEANQNTVMKTYLVQKKVLAAKIIHIDQVDEQTTICTPTHRFEVSEAWRRKYKPEKGMWFVMSDEGYYCRTDAAFATAHFPVVEVGDSIRLLPTEPTPSEVGCKPGMDSAEHPRPILINYHRIPGDIVNEGIELRAVGEVGSGGAHTEYQIDIPANSGTRHVLNLSRHITLRFHVGNPIEEGVKGLTNEVILAAIIHRMEGFESGQFFCEDDELALRLLKAAMLAFHARSAKRQARGVEGKLIA